MESCDVQDYPEEDPYSINTTGWGERLNALTRSYCKMKSNLVIIAMALIATLLAGSSFAAEQMLTSEEQAMLQPSNEFKAVRYYDYPDFNVKDYPKALIGAITIYYADDSKSKAIDPDDLKIITDKIRQSLTLNLSRHVEIVDEPGPGVALSNVAIVKVKYANKKRGLLGYTPVGFVATSAANAANIRVALADAKIQGELVDSVSGKHLSIFEIHQIKKAKKQMEWEDVQATLKDFTRRLVDSRFAQTQ
jgi:hypothetical protein